MDTINIGKKREVFWDNYIVDEEKSTTIFRSIKPEKKEVCFTFDKGGEPYGLTYHCIVKDEKGYKLYYVCWNEWKSKEYNHEGARLAVIESQDGINWTRPCLNPDPQCDLENVIMDYVNNGVFVFLDPNPAVKPDEKYKAVMCEWLPEKDKHELWCYTSADGYNFKKSVCMTDKGRFDSLNTVLWENGKYICYYRGVHGDEYIRDVRRMESVDFVNWSDFEYIKFDDNLDYPLYTNNISHYDSIDSMKIGFPVRYCERSTDNWTENMKQMPSFENKKTIADLQNSPRTVTSATDAILITSRDGLRFKRYGDAFFTPDYETEDNWVYGDCYPAYGLVDGKDDCYYMYLPGNHRSLWKPKTMTRYEIKKDRFAASVAEYGEKILVTKPIIFEGEYLHLNFTTTAYGYIYVDVLDTNGNPISKQSFEIFGDTVDRKISFSNGDSFGNFAGKPVRLRFRMREAKLYSMKFE